MIKPSGLSRFQGVSRGTVDGLGWEGGHWHVLGGLECSQFTLFFSMG